MKERLGRSFIFIVLIGMSVAVPLLIQAIFPAGQRKVFSSIPLEEPASREADRLTPEQRQRLESRRLRENYAWLRGDQRSALDAAIPSTELPADVEQEGEASSKDGSAPLDLRPGVFLAYTRIWDNLDIVREQSTAGGFFYIKDHSRVQAAAGRLWFSDTSDEIEGSSAHLDLAHRLPKNWFVQEGIHVDHYNGLHSSVNGYAQAYVRIREKLVLGVQAAREDMWEQLQNIRGKLRVTSGGVSAYLEFRPKWWLSGLTNWAGYSDDNSRSFNNGEIGYFLSERIGLSVAAGGDLYSFDSQKGAYWSPHFYSFLYGRLRLTRNFYEELFPSRLGEWRRWRNRLGYLAEYTAGVNDEGRLEQIARGGVSVNITERLSARAEFSHLASQDRFSSSYDENRLDAKVQLRF